MAWRGNRPVAGRIDAGPARADWAAAVRAFAVQLPVIGLISMVDAATQADDDVGYGGTLGLLYLLPVLMLIVPLLGLLHAAVHTMPAAALAHLVFRRARGPRWAWHLLCAAVVALVWAGVAALLLGWSFTTVSGWLTGLVVLPVLWIAYERSRAEAVGRAPGWWGAWLRAAFASCLLCGAVGAGALLGTRV
ncbi:hypothetical protein NGF19_21140 [Streptomyces sp. RY43-2]|uniref:Uncharacterized protein n=1 Tax=Streptomyces macrolidinus TaxID=2952607 RepID=A0ABT0ZI36_9ACTN|nr:hypothetical protein [Streptomyces macrolidinus]MCN9243259.1 hypothetical protein [Streptomyces macrolidinus]